MFVLDDHGSYEIVLVVASTMHTCINFGPRSCELPWTLTGTCTADTHINRCHGFGPIPFLFSCKVTPSYCFLWLSQIHDCMICICCSKKNSGKEKITSQSEEWQNRLQKPWERLTTITVRETSFNYGGISCIERVGENVVKQWKPDEQMKGGNKCCDGERNQPSHEGRNQMQLRKGKPSTQTVAVKNGETISSEEGGIQNTGSCSEGRIDHLL